MVQSVYFSIIYYSNDLGMQMSTEKLHRIYNVRNPKVKKPQKINQKRINAYSVAKYKVG